MLSDYQKYIHKSRYARWNDATGHREDWEDTVDRYVDFWVERIKKNTNITEENKKILLELLG